MVPHAPQAGGAGGYPRVGMPTSAPLAILLAAPPGAPGASAVAARLATAAAAGRNVRVLLSAGGLAWTHGDHRDVLAHASDVAVCSRNAREVGWTAEATPEGVRWSSVATWLAELDAQGRAALWAVLP